MSKALTTREFFAKFPTDEACLEHLFEVRFGQTYPCPRCKRETKWYRIKAERAYSCQFCGHHLHPTVGTPFESSRTSLQSWFYAIHLFTTTRHGVSAKELQRQLGVTYKTAWRMGHEIRRHMDGVDGEGPVGGRGKEVQIDETFIGGVAEGVGRGNYLGNKTVVIGILEEGGELIAETIPDRSLTTVEPIIRRHVEPGSIIHTDEAKVYNRLTALGYVHNRVNHAAKEYVGPRGETVNAVENFWRHLKVSISGTHTSVSRKHMNSYVKEFEYRFNRRERASTMFAELISVFPQDDEPRG